MILSIDAMGGDYAPHSILRGAALVLRDKPHLRFLLHGDAAKMKPILNDEPELAKASEIRHTDKAIGMDEAPALALRKEGRQSSMWRTLESVQKEEAAIAVSAGNTGALMGMSKLVLKTLPNIDRPAIAGRWPSRNDHPTLILDLGATVSLNARQFVQLAVMGIAAAQPLIGVKNPKVGLLNVGAEDIKGTPEIKEAAHLCQKLIPDNFHGFVEGNEIAEGNVDVVVTDGFSGNIALKAAEGTAWLLLDLLRENIQMNWRTKLGGLLAKPAFSALLKRIEPGRFNGGVFLGLERLAVKSHGGCDTVSFASAIHSALRCAQFDLVNTISQALAAMQLEKISSLSENHTKPKEAI